MNLYFALQRGSCASAAAAKTNVASAPIARLNMVLSAFAEFAFMTYPRLLVCSEMLPSSDIECGRLRHHLGNVCATLRLHSFPHSNVRYVTHAAQHGRRRLCEPGWPDGLPAPVGGDRRARRHHQGAAHASKRRQTAFAQPCGRDPISSAA